MTEIKLKGYILHAGRYGVRPNIIIQKNGQNDYCINMIDQSGVIEIIRFDAQPQISGAKLPKSSVRKYVVDDGYENLLHINLYQIYDIEEITDHIGNMAIRCGNEMNIRDPEGFCRLVHYHTPRRFDVLASFVGLKKSDYLIHSLQPLIAMLFDRAEIEHTRSRSYGPYGYKPMSDVAGFGIKFANLFVDMSEFGISQDNQTDFFNRLSCMYGDATHYQPPKNWRKPANFGPYYPEEEM